MQFADLLTKVSYLPPSDVEVLSRAYDAAASAHHDQNRLSGEKFIEHPLSVAGILADLQLDRDTLAAAILHDTVEDTHLTVSDLEQSFGPTVGKLVAGVTKLEKISFHSQEQAQAENVRKMLVAMGEDFDEIYDLSAIRVTTDSIKDCYGALGVIHSLWKPIPGRFKDYIAMPKSNGYQSLHTTVVSHSGEPMEIQIRTQEMHRTAEWGVAAHWTYKESGGKDDRKMDQRFAWLRQLIDWQKEVLDAEKFVDAVKVDVFRDEVFVFTPKGDVLALPTGATAVDFAYRIHTEVGHRCIGAKANGRMVPLDYPLQNGDIVEVLTSKGPHGPSRDWLGFVKTAGAAQKIRGWFKKERREENVSKGKELLDKDFRRMQQRALASIGDERILELARELRL